MNKRIKILYLIFIILFSGLAITFFRSQLGVIILFFLSLFIFIYFKLFLAKSLTKAFLIWLGYSGIQIVLHGTFTDFFIFRHIVFLFTAYTLILLFKERIFIYFEKIIYFLAIISLVFYFWLVVNPSSLLAFGRMLDFSNNLFSGRPNYYSFLIYTIDYYGENTFQRNSGFCWEPGPFSIYINIAIYLNLIRTKLRFKRNPKLYVLIATLITTQSTTGLMVFGIIISYLSFFEIKKAYKFVLFPILFSLFIYAFFSIPLLYEKIYGLYEAGIEIEETTMKYNRLAGQSYSSGRFGGMIIGWHDFKNYPLFGIGGNDELSYGYFGTSTIYIVNGLANIMSTYGLFGIFIYVFMTFKSSNYISKLFQSKSKMAFFLIIIPSSFAFGLDSQIILFTLIFSGYFQVNFRTKRTTPEVVFK